MRAHFREPNRRRYGAYEEALPTFSRAWYGFGTETRVVAAPRKVRPECQARD